MARNVALSPKAIDDFGFWMQNDLKIAKKLVKLFDAISRDPFDGIGKPEALKGDFRGFWSRRIDDEHRLIYKVLSDEDIIVVSCHGHYDD